MMTDLNFPYKGDVWYIIKGYKENTKHFRRNIPGWLVFCGEPDTWEGRFRRPPKEAYQVKQVLQQLRQYRKDTFLCIGLTALEVLMEILLPFITARLIDEGLEMANLPTVYRYGAVLVVLALVSLVFGALAGKYAASASSGLSANLREAIYARIQTFSFSNIDKFSVPGLVTRMTTDITNVQNAFMMVIRIAVRAPMLFVFSFAMCLFISPATSQMFLFAVVFLVEVLGANMVVKLNIFKRVFQKYDDLNASVQENISAIRVVKAFVREGYENNKFSKASGNLYRMFVKAEGLLAFNNPAMMLAVYFCILSASWLGAQFIVAGDKAFKGAVAAGCEIHGVASFLILGIKNGVPWKRYAGHQKTPRDRLGSRQKAFSVWL